MSPQHPLKPDSRITKNAQPVRLLSWATGILLLAGCATPPPAAPPPAVVTPPPPVETPKPVKPAVKPVRTPAATAPVVRQVRSADGSITGEIVGTPTPNSKFSRLQIGMTRTQVENLIGHASNTDSRVTGKQYQPFYFGGDTRRTEAYYRDEGQLTFSNRRHDDAPDTLIRIVVKPDNVPRQDDTHDQ